MTAWEYRVWQENGDIVGWFEVHATSEGAVIEDYPTGMHVRTLEDYADVERARQAASSMVQDLKEEAIKEAIADGVTAEDGVMHMYGISVQEVEYEAGEIPGVAPTPMHLAWVDFPAQPTEAIGHQESSPAPAPGASRSRPSNSPTNRRGARP